MSTESPTPTTEWLPPPAVLYELATAHYVSRALYVAAELAIADLLAPGPQSSADLARATRTNADALRRVLRLLVSAGVFAEEADGRFALTPVGESLRGDLPGSSRSMALLFGGPLVQSSWGDLGYSVRTGQPALPHVFGKDSFEYLEEHPEEAAIFDDAMAGFTAFVGVAVAGAYDFSPFRTVVDVGGGNGALLTGILNAYPALHGIVFDRPRVAEGARAKIAAAGLAGRCDVASGDFFTTVPGGADAYLLKHVIHDWDDARALEILRTCHRAMPPQGKLLIVEGVYPGRIDQSALGRGAARNDVNMLICTGGRQRSEAEFRALYDAAGFELLRIVPTPAMASVIEGARR